MEINEWIVVVLISVVILISPRAGSIADRMGRMAESLFRRNSSTD